MLYLNDEVLEKREVVGDPKIVDTKSIIKNLSEEKKNILKQINEKNEAIFS